MGIAETAGQGTFAVMLAPAQGRSKTAMSLVIICLAITATLMVSLHSSEEPEEVRMTMDDFLAGEVANMAKIDDARSQKARQAQQAKKAKALRKASKKASGDGRPSLMTMSRGDLSKLKSSDAYKDRMEDEDNFADVSDSELAMPSVTKQGEVSMFQDHHEESSEARALNRLLNGNRKKKRKTELDSFQASLLGEKIAPKKPKHTKPQVHLSRLLEPRSTRTARPARPRRTHQTAKMKKRRKQQEQHKRKEAKKVNSFREHMKSFWAKTHAADPNRKPKLVPKPAPKKKVECKPPMCLPRGHHYEHGKVQHGHKAVITALEQAYPVSKPKPKKPVSIWDRDDTFSPIETTAQDVLISNAVPKLNIQHKHKKVVKKRMSLEDLVGELASKDKTPPNQLKKKKKKVAKKVEEENPWEQDHFARRMSNTWQKENAMRTMKMALLNAEHHNANDLARKMAPTLNRHERIAQKSAMLKRNLKAQSIHRVKKQFDRDFARRQQAAKVAAFKKMQQKKRMQRQRAKKAKVVEAKATKVAADAVETAFANVFDESWQKNAPNMGLNIPHGPKA